MSTERTILKLHTHQSLETKCIKRGSPYRWVVSIGAIRSGKSLVIARWMLDRGQWDTGQLHGIFANTKGQLDGILQDVMPWVEAAGIEWQAHRRPPKEWIERWRKQGIPAPPRRASYRGILILSNGFHAQMGSLENRAHTKFKGSKYGSVVFEEVCTGRTTWEGVRYIAERVNCGIGPARCAELHHHVKIMHANPPDDDGHWIFGWLAEQDARIAKAAGAQSTAAEDDSYPSLLRGIGDVIYIPSRTIDNVENLPGDFIEDMAAAVDEDTAKKLLDGVLTRSRKGRVYSGFGVANQIDTIPYDPKRTLYVSLDFNTNPAVCIYAHPLKPGEYPNEHESPNVTHLGVFGEVFHVGGMDVAGLGRMMLTGEPGSAGALPDNFRGLLNHETRITFFGDASANYEQMSQNHWQIIDDVCGSALKGRYGRNVQGKQNPLVPIGVHAVNAKFKNADGIMSLWIHPRCEHLITDLLTNTWHKTNPNKIYKPNWGAGRFTTHEGDSLRYLVSTLFPFGREAGTNRPQVVRGTPRRRSVAPSFI